MPANTTAGWQVQPTAGASVVSSTGNMVVIKPLARGTFTLNATIASAGGAQGSPAPKQIRAGAADPLSIHTRTQEPFSSWNYSYILNYGEAYYLELYPANTALINKYEWTLIPNNATSIPTPCYWSAYSYPYTAGNVAPSDSITVGFINADDDMLILDPPSAITLYARFRDCMGWSPYIVQPVTINNSLLLAVYPNPSSTTLHIDIAENPQTTLPSPAASLSTGVCRVRLVSVQSGATALNQTVGSFSGHLEFNVSSLPDGWYSLILTQNNDIVHTQTILIQH
jgi:hypothetical protein